MKNNKILYFIFFALLIISPFMINPIYCKYTNKYSREITINIRKPNYKVVFNSNTPTGSTVTGNVADQNFVYGISQNLHQNNYAVANYNYLNWNTLANGTGTTYTNNQQVTNLTKKDNAIINLYAIWDYIAKPTITRSDYNTFTYSAPAGAAYYVSKSSTQPSDGNTSSVFALDTWTTTTNTGDLTLASGEIYYVFVKDADGRISANSTNIAVRTVTRTQGTGTTLTTKYDSASGIAFTQSSVYVLDGTNINVGGSLTAGYNTLVLKKDNTVVSAGNYVINKDTHFESSAILNKLTLTINKDGAACTTCNGYTINISTSASSNTATWTGTTTTSNTLSINGTMNAGTTYYVWVGEDSNHKSTMKYSGVSFTGAPAASATINFYTITGALSNSTISFNGTNLANGGELVALGSTNAIHAIITAPGRATAMGTATATAMATARATASATAARMRRIPAATRNNTHLRAGESAAGLRVSIRKSTDHLH